MIYVVSIDLEGTLLPRLSDLCWLIDRRMVWDTHKDAISKTIPEAEFKKVEKYMNSCERFNLLRANLPADIASATGNRSLARECANLLPRITDNYNKNIDYSKYFAQNEAAQHCLPSFFYPGALDAIRELRETGMFPVIVTHLNHPEAIQDISREINKLTGCEVPILSTQADHDICDGYAGGGNKAKALSDYMRNGTQDPWVLSACIGDQPAYDLTIPYFIAEHNLPAGAPENTLLIQADSWSLSERRLESKHSAATTCFNRNNKNIEINTTITPTPQQALSLIMLNHLSAYLSNGRVQ